MGFITSGIPHRARVRTRRLFRRRAVGISAAALLCGLFGLGAIAVSSVPSGAAASSTLFVDNVNGTNTTGCTASGSGACKTIQEGVTAAEALAGTNVTLDVAGSATAYSESVAVNVPSGDSLDIEGTGNTLPTLDNGGTGSGFTIASTSVGDVTIDHMTISHGSAESGGAINDLSTATLTVGFDTFSNNTATGVGGAACGDGGAIDVGDGCEGATGGTLTVTDSTFTGNAATGGSRQDGGAIDANQPGGGPPTPGKLSVLNSTFQSNRAAQGGAVVAFQTGNSITNSTFASNTATGFGGSGFAGDNTALVFDTFFGNSGPALLRDGAGGNTLANSILADAPAAECFAGSVTDNGHNVASDATCGLGGTSIQSSTTIGTLSLAANGSSGPQTAAITPSSSAAGIVPTSACTPNTDQRGQPRPGIGYTACDAGAYELQKSTGYDLAGSDGGVFVFPVGQPKGYFGSLPGLGVHPNLPVVGLVPTNNYNGYNLAASDGGVFVFPVGMTSGFYGSLPGLGVKVSNVVGLVSTNNNHGYNLVGSDGGVFVFPTGQSAGYYGSLPGLGVHVNNIVGIVEQPDGGGYLLVGRDGGVFAFGDAKYYGSLPGSGISANNIVGIAPTFDGKGYFLVGNNGSVYPFGDAVSHGSLPAMGINVSNIVSVVPTADLGGYWLIGSDGGVFAFGDAGFVGSLPGLTPPVRVNNVVGAVPTLF
jgi:hypothetical protein